MSDKEKLESLYRKDGKNPSNHIFLYIRICFQILTQMRKSITFLLVLFIGLPALMCAQAYKPMRVEYSTKLFNQLRIIPATKNRVVSFLRYSKRNSRGDTYKVSALDANFKTLWSKDIIIPNSYSLNEYEIENDSILHLLIVKNNGDNASFLKLRINIDNGSYTSYYFKGNRRSLLVGLKLFEGRLYLYGVGLEYIQEQLDTYNASTKYEKILTAKVPKNYHIISALADTVNHRFIILVKNSKSAPGELRLMEFDSQGAMLQAHLLTQNTQQNIVNGNLVYSEDSEVFFIGTYNNSTKKSKRDVDEAVSGVFIGKISGNKFEFFRFYRFSEFNNIKKILSYREQKMVASETGKGKSFNLYIDLLMHKKILKNNGEFIIVGESYFPVYHYETMYDGRGYMYQTEVFDGYQTTNALAAAFDSKGELLWDNYIHVSGVQAYYLDENVTVYNDDETQVFMYYLNEKIYSKVTQENQTVFIKEATDLPTVMSGESVLAEDNGKIMHWNQSYFLISGYQKVYGLDGKNRKVFFITAVAFQ